jgi:DNA-binding HxlR family transcriptional regulator
MGQPKRTERGFQPGKCPLTAVMNVIGGKWAGVIWYRLSEGPMRCADLRRSIDGISQKMLNEQLRDFVEHGIVIRHEDDSVPPKVEYALTDYGLSLGPVYQALCEWGGNILRWCISGR